MSAKTVARMVDAGEMPSERRGISGRRMVLASEVIAYRERSAKDRKKNLAQTRRVAFDSGPCNLDQGYIDKDQIMTAGVGREGVILGANIFLGD
ncbi:hypothetical protein [Bifidobacterium sp. ESL0800]|uniref:hypothetical protein n=1 Tax=Bifidobacterium sp. ESL0800 TaxID=2983236 RepID=UPI0023F686DA|nr:hypothetical protein [Bifidobacterium sp. ESL0800]WEV75355.1 hypothetical protein OZX75_06920 [Bifidobacterium sp. ESL0800]